MSKAFTKELDETFEVIANPVSSLPFGVKNFMTPGGMEILRGKLSRLMAGPVTASTRQGINKIRADLQSAVVVEPPPQPWDQVLFGAVVTVRDQHKQEITYRLVGVDEANPEKNDISWRSPVARALLKARVRDRIHFNAPGGDQNLEKIDIRY